MVMLQKRLRRRVPDLTSKNLGQETGVITRLMGDKALVQMEMQPTCESCAARVLCVPDRSGKRILKAANPFGAKIGSRVVVNESDNFLLKLSSIQYGIPLIGFLLGIIICYVIDLSIAEIAPEFIMFAGGITGLGLSALIARNLAQKLAQQGREFFIISKIL